MAADRASDIDRRSLVDVVCLGILVADVVLRPFTEVPKLGTLGLVEQLSLHGGGCALNTATILTRLGLNVRVVGRVGRAPFGDFLRRLLAERGIDGGRVVTDEV